MKTNNKCAAVRLEKSRLLAALAVLAVAFVALAAIPAVDATGDASTSVIDVDDITKLTGNKAGEYRLMKDITVENSVKISAKVTLDLNGFTLTGKNCDTIVVDSSGELTVKDSSANKTGTVDVIGNTKAAVKNEGTTTLDGGIFERSEATYTYTGKEEKYQLSTTDSHYTVQNLGTMTVNKVTIIGYVPEDNVIGENIRNDTKREWGAASCITNGYYSTNGMTNPSVCKLTIDGATIIGGLNTVKNDDCGEMTIVNGTFYNYIQVSVQNHNVATIKGGVFTGAQSAVHNHPCDTSNDKGELTINGGTFEYASGYADVWDNGSIAGKITVGENVNLSIKDENAKTEIVLSKNSSVTFTDGSKMPSKISNGDSYATFSNVIAKNEAKISAGSIIIEGDYNKDSTSGTITITGNAKVSGTVDADVTLTVASGAVAVVDTNLVVKGTLKVDGTLINNGTLDVTANTAAQTIDGTIVSNDGATTKLKEQADDKVVGKYTYGTGTESKGTDKVSVSTVEDLYYAIANGVKAITFAPTAACTLDCDKGTKYGVTVIVDVNSSTGATNVALTGKISGDLTIIGNCTVTFTGTTTVNNGVVLTLGKDATLADGAVFNLYGAIAGYKSGTPATVAKVTVTVDGDKTSFKAFSGAQIGQTVTITGTGKIDLSQAQGPQTVGEDISADKEYGQLENVTVVGSLTIKNNSTVTVRGGFQVNEDVTLTIEKGSKLYINSSSAAMNIAGRIIVEEGGYLIVDDANEVVVSGSIESEGTVTIDSNVTVKSGGEILINDGDDSSFTAGEELTIESGASLVIKASVGSDTTVSNKGTIALNGAVLGGAFTIKMLADGAVADIQSVSGNKLVTISDLGLEFNKTESVSSENENKIKFTPDAETTVKGLTVVEKVSSYVYVGTTYYTNTMDIAGSVAVASETVESPAATVGVSGKNLAVTGALALGKKVTLNVTGEKSVLKVSGNVTATEDGSTITSAGTIDVTGLVQTVKKIDSGINAAMYETKSGTATIYNYSTLKTAVDSGAKDISVLGEISVTETLTVSAGVTVKNNGTIVVGSDDSTDVVLTFADGASVRYGIIDVYGTLVFDNKKDNKANEIRSDVSVIGDVSAKYTNLYTALSEAQSGDTVTITRDGTVDIKKNLTIKEGVTLDVPNSKKISVADGVTLTVAGTLKTAEAVDAETAFAEKASARDPKASAIVVTGTFMSMAPVEYSNYVIAGAYYSLTDSVGAYNYVTTVENAAKVAASVAGGEIEINGKVSAGDIAFTGTSTQTVRITVMPGAMFTVASVTLDDARLYTSGDTSAVGVFTGRIVIGDSAVDAKNAYIWAGADDDGQMCVFVQKTFEGEPVSYADRNSDSTFSVSSGKVFVEYAGIKVTVASGATLVSYDGYESIIYGDLQIDGTVSVGSGETISVTGNVIVNGVLSVADETDTENAGTFEVDGVMYVGVTEKATTGEDVSVSGPVDVSKYVVASVGASISDSTIDSFKNASGKLVSTTYVVEDKDWIVVYSIDGTAKIGVIKKAPVENAKFEGEWKNSKDKDANNELVGAENFDKVYAVIEYDIYTIQITSCAGIESIAIDGNLLDYTALYDGLKVKAGSHTISYSLMNGYSGDAKLSLVSSDDKTTASVSGMSFTVSGDKGVVKLQLTGIEKSGYVDPTPVTPSDDGKDGMSLTDILLIVLVVLIVIMAVIVAMRLMRS